MMYVENFLVWLLWFINLVHVPELDDVFNPYVGLITELEELDIEPEEELRPFVQKSYVSREGGKSKVFEYAAYMNVISWTNDEKVSEWDLEPLSLDSDQLHIYADWTKYDDFILNLKGWTSEKRIFSYKEVRGGVLSGLTYQQIANQMNKSLSHVKTYGGAVREMVEYRRQAERKLVKSVG